MVQLTTEKILSRNIDINELDEKRNKKFSKIIRKKKKNETGLKTFFHLFSLTILFWFA